LQTFDEFASGRSDCPHGGPKNARGFETAFFLDFAADALKNCQRAFNPKDCSPTPEDNEQSCACISPELFGPVM
jgi:hypothetical protein